MLPRTPGSAFASSTTKVSASSGRTADRHESASLQVVRGRESRLPAADHDDVDGRMFHVLDPTRSRRTGFPKPRRRAGYVARCADPSAEGAQWPRGITPSAYRSAATSCSAVSATRCVMGPYDTRATPSASYSAADERTGQADDADLALADAFDQLPRHVGVQDAGNEHEVGPCLEVRAATGDRVGDRFLDGPVVRRARSRRCGRSGRTARPRPLRRRSRPRRPRRRRRAAGGGLPCWRRRRPRRSRAGRSHPGRRNRNRGPPSREGLWRPRSGRPCRA